MTDMIHTRGLGRAAPALAGLAVLAGVCVGPVPARAAGTAEPVCVSTDGALANSDCLGGSLSADGRFVTFVSEADNLVPGDTNGTWDVFVRDRKLGTTERVSVGPDGEQANGNSDRALITPDGRFVAFVSDATNLVPDDTNGRYDVFVRDRKLGTTERVSVGTNGVQGDSDSGDYGVAISADGRFVAFASDATNLVVPHDTARLTDVFVRDRRAGTTTRVSGRPNGLEADGGSYGPAISADGRFVAFGSYATNLVPHDTNGTNDIFVHDQQTGRTERVSLGQGGAQANGDSYDTAISADGRFVAFDSSASNLVPHDTNGAGCGSDPECGQDVFVRDRRLRTTERVSLRPNGHQYVLPSELVDISADGRLVAFDALFPRPPIPVPRGATGLVRDRRTGRTTVVYRGEDGCDNGLTAISPDGRVVTFGTGCGASEWFQLYVRERP